MPIRNQHNTVLLRPCDGVFGGGPNPINIGNAFFEGQSAKGVDFRNLFFEFAKIEDARFVDCHFQSIEDFGTNLTGASFENVGFKGCHFYGASALGARFENCTFYDIDIQGAWLVDAVFDACCFQNVQFRRDNIYSNCNIKGAQFLDCKFDEVLFEEALRDTRTRFSPVSDLGSLGSFVYEEKG